MDFKSLLSKLDSMEAPASTPAAPTLDKAVQLNEDAQLRVLAGQTTYVAEAKKKKDEEVKEEMKVGDKKSSSTGGTIEKTATGVKHSAGKNYGGDKAPKDDEDDEPKAKKAKKESVEPEFKSKFMKMVEAKKEEAADKKKADAKKEKMAEGGLPMTTVNGKKVPAFAADGKGKNDLGKGKDKEADDSDEPNEKKDDKKGMSDKQAKYFGKKTESAMMPKGKKRPVKESVENVLSFRDMIKLVQESGGQQAIDPIDTTLFAWAQRVAASKYTESAKAEVFAGMLYERNGGRFEMYDVLSESKKKIIENRLDEGMFDKVKSAIMSKVLPKLSSDEKLEMADAVTSVLGTDQVSMKDLTIDNVKAVAKALGAKPKTANAEMGEDEDSYFDKSATLGEKLASIGGLVGGIGSLVAAFGFSGPGWLIIPGIIGIMFMSQIGTSKKGSY